MKGNYNKHYDKKNIELNQSIFGIKLLFCIRLLIWPKLLLLFYNYYFNVYLIIPFVVYD